MHTGTELFLVLSLIQNLIFAILKLKFKLGFTIVIFKRNKKYFESSKKEKIQDKAVILLRVIK